MSERLWQDDPRWPDGACVNCSDVRIGDDGDIYGEMIFHSTDEPCPL